MASNAGQLVLFDIPSQSGLCWSPNTWKIRLLLAHKGLAYRTEWVEYPEIEPRLKALNVPPNPEEEDDPHAARYTVPALTFEDGTTVMDSGAIGTRIEAEHPTPPMPGIPSHTVLAGPTTDPDTLTYERTMPGVMGPLRDVFLPRVVEVIVNEASRDFRGAKAVQQLGNVSLADAKARFDWATAKEKLAPSVQAVADFANKPGPWLTGPEPVWIDVRLLSGLLFMRAGGQDIYDAIMAAPGSEVLQRLHDAAEARGWLSKTD